MMSHRHSSFARLVACAIALRDRRERRAAARRRRQRCRRRHLADGRDDQPGADTCGPARVHVQCRVPGRAQRAQGGAGPSHAGTAAGDRLLGRRRCRPLERDHAGDGVARRPAAAAERRRHLLGARCEQPVRRTAVPVRQPALRGPRLQLRLGGAVRCAQGGLALQVPLQPPVAVGRRRRRPRAAADQRAAVLPVRRRGAVGSDRRAAQAAVPDQRRGDQPEGGRAARGRAALGPGVRQRPRGRPRARQRRGGAVHRPRRHRRHAHRWRLAGAVRRPRRGGDRARRDPVAQPRVAAASAHAGRVRQRPGVDDDPGGHPSTSGRRRRLRRPRR